MAQPYAIASSIVHYIKNSTNERGGIGIGLRDREMIITYSKIGAKIYKYVEKPKIDKKQVKEYNELSDKLLVFPDQLSILKYLLSCKRRAFIGDKSELDDFIKFSKSRPGAYPLTAGKDKYLKTNLFWQFPYAAGLYIRLRMSHLIQSGIYKMWENIYNARRRDELDVSLKQTIRYKQTLQTNLGPLFKILVLLQFIAFVIFLLELIFEKLYLMIKNFKNGLIFTFRKLSRI